MVNPRFSYYGADALKVEQILYLESHPSLAQRHTMGADLCNKNIAQD